MVSKARVQTERFQTDSPGRQGPETKSRDTVSTQTESKQTADRLRRLRQRVQTQGPEQAERASAEDPTHLQTIPFRPFRPPSLSLPVDSLQGYSVDLSCLPSAACVQTALRLMV